MSDSKRSWLRDLLLIPLIVGIIVAVVTFVLPMMFDKDKELSYSLQDSTKYIDQETVGTLKVEVDGVLTSSLYAHKVTIWNSGDVPLKNLPVLFMFNTKEADFKIFSVRHETSPAYEFGKIKEEGSTDKSKRFIFELLNPNDKDEVTILSNKWAILTVHSKSEGLKLELVKQDRKKWFEWAGTFLSVIAAFIAILLKSFGESYNEIYQWIKLRIGKKED